MLTLSGKIMHVCLCHNETCLVLSKGRHVCMCLLVPQQDKPSSDTSRTSCGPRKTSLLVATSRTLSSEKHNKCSTICFFGGLFGQPLGEKTFSKNATSVAKLPLDSGWNHMKISAGVRIVIVWMWEAVAVWKIHPHCPGSMSSNTLWWDGFSKYDFGHKPDRHNSYGCTATNNFTVCSTRIHWSFFLGPDYVAFSME